jgi:outer membrane protein OmpA-like peptidoglycan-associated protein
MKYKIIIFIISALFVIAYETKAQAIEYNIPDEAYEGLFDFKYRYWSRYISAFVYKDSTFIPLTQVFSMLKVFNDYSPKSGTISGFYIEKDSLYELDFRNNTAFICDRKHELYPDEYIITDMEVYVQPKLIKRVFGLPFRVNPAKLMIKLDDEFKMPIWIEKERKELYNNLGKNKTGYSTLLFDRNWSILNGLLISYNFSTSIAQDLSSSFNMGLNAGAELLGGSLNIFSNANYSPSFNTFLFNYTGNWQYLFPNNPIITNLIVGDFSPKSYSYSSLPSLSIRGVSITNSRDWTSRKYSLKTYEDKTNPDWQVEMWRDNELYDIQRADPLGNYRFEVPINYGTNIIETRFFGPKGEFENKRDIVQISPQFLKPFEINYSLSAGYLPDYRDRAGNPIYNWLYDGRFALGLTDWAVNDFGVMKPDGYNEFTYYDNISFRFFGGSVLPSLGFSPKKYYMGSLYVNLDNWGSYNFMINHYPKTSEINSSGANNSAYFSGSLPPALNLPFYTTFNLKWTDYDLYDMYDLDSRITIPLNPWFLDIGYKGKLLYSSGNYAIGHGITPTIRYIYRGLVDLWEQLTVTSFMLSSSYDFNYGSFGFVGLRINQDLKDYGGFVLRFEYIIREKNFRADLRYNVDFDFFSNRTAVTYGRSGASVTESIRGIMGLDSYSWDFLFSNVTGGTTPGRGAASFRYFVDLNGNGEYDSDETLIPGIKTKLDGASDFDKKKENEVRRAYNLVPFGQYNVTVDKKSLRNPLYVPTSTEFSFISDPNSYKPINIPCYAAGIVEGSVILDVSIYKMAQTRVQIHIVAKDTTKSTYHEVFPVFNDGSFYMMAVPPGDYYMYVDTMQQKALEVVPTKMTEITVKSVADGDFVGDVQLEIVPKELAQYIVDGSLQVPESVKEQLKKDKKFKYSTLAKGLPNEIDTVRLPDYSIGTSKDLSIGKTSLDSNITKDNFPKVDTTVADNGENVTSIAEDYPVVITPNIVKTLLYDTKDATDLSIEMKVYLSRVQAYMVANSKALVEIVAYSDPYDQLEKAGELTKKRAEAAMKYLLGKGVPEDRIFTIAKGSLQPIPDSNPIFGSKPNRNRRIEVRVIE